MKQLNLRDAIGGGLMMAVGLAAVVKGQTYQIGTLQHMGSGFFPVTLGVLLTAVGLGIVFSLGDREAVAAGGIWAKLPELRAWIPILGSVVAFVVVGQYGGLVPATFAVVFISAFADRQNTFLRALVLSASMVVVCVVIFWWALMLQFPLFQWG